MCFYSGYLTITSITQLIVYLRVELAAAKSKNVLEFIYVFGYYLKDVSIWQRSLINNNIDWQDSCSINVYSVLICCEPELRSKWCYILHKNLIENIELDTLWRNAKPASHVTTTKNLWVFFYLIKSTCAPPHNGIFTRYRLKLFSLRVAFPIKRGWVE